jgi:acyl CoA:acetate/3-ketoacid CoA transferase
MDEAAALVPDGAYLVIEGSGGGVVEPSGLIEALGRRYADAGSPSGLTVMFASGLGDRVSTGADHLAAPGLLKRTILGHYGMSPKLAAMAEAGEIEAYNLPQGVIVQLLREVAGHRPGLITKTGLGTFVDPRQAGGRLNPATTEQIVEVVEIGGEEWLRYKPFAVDVAFIRGTTADERGNITIEKEPARLGLTSMATAARNSGGVVVAQVERIAAAGTLHPRDVVVPGHLVDYVVVDPDQWQTVEHRYNPSFSGELKVPLGEAGSLELDERTVIGRRAFAEFPRGAVVNLGVGMPDAVAAVANERGALGDITLTIEQGLSGGMPARGVVFGVAWNPEAMIDQHLQFDFYDGGGLDVTCLGFAQIDRAGNVNSSHIAGRIFGVGGFVNISQGARKVVFCGTLTSGGLKVTIGDGRLEVVQEGRHRKLLDAVSQVTFNGPQAVEGGREVVYVTERAVFRLTPEGLELVEIAPGVDLERDVLGQMDFAPILRTPVPLMDAALFT